MLNRIIVATLMILMLSANVYAADKENQDKLADPAAVPENKVAANNNNNNSSENIFEVHMGLNRAYDQEFIIREASAEEGLARFEGQRTSQMLVLSTSNLLSNSSKWNLIVEAGYSEIDLNLQKLNDGTRFDFGTRVSGRYYFIMPAFYYSTSDIVADTANEVGFRFGGGLGIADLDVAGSAVYTNPGSDQTVIHPVNVNRAGLMSRLFIEYHYKRLVVGLDASGASGFGDDDTPQEKEYSVIELSFNLGLVVTF